MALPNEPAVASVLTGAVVLLSLVLVFLAFRAWLYARESRTFLLLVAFGLYAIRSLCLLAGLFLLEDWEVLLLASVAFDLVILAGFYFASLR